MSEYITLYEFDDRWFATQIVIDRTPIGGKISFSVTFTKVGETKTLMFDRPDDPDNIIELIDVERVVVSKEINSQREYGTIRVEFIGDACSEVWCDSVALKESSNGK